MTHTIRTSSWKFISNQFQSYPILNELNFFTAIHMPDQNYSLTCDLHSYQNARFSIYPWRISIWFKRKSFHNSASITFTARIICSNIQITHANDETRRHGKRILEEERTMNMQGLKLGKKTWNSSKDNTKRRLVHMAFTLWYIVMVQHL